MVQYKVEHECTYTSRLGKGVSFFSSYCFGRSTVKVMAGLPGGDLIYGYLVDGWFDRYMIGNNHLCAMAQNRLPFVAFCARSPDNSILKKLFVYY